MDRVCSRRIGSPVCMPAILARPPSSDCHLMSMVCGRRGGARRGAPECGSTRRIPGGLPMRHVLIAAALCGVTLLAGCSQKAENSSAAAAAAAPPQKFAAVDSARLLAANEPANAGQWMSYGRDYAEQRFSPLKSINTETVKNLGLAWYGDFDTRRGQESTPIVVDGVI